MIKRMIHISLYVLLVLVVWVGVTVWEAAGKLPTGERLARCEQSAHWRDGEFRNEHATPQLTGGDGMAVTLWKFLFERLPELKPSHALPVVKTRLHALGRDEEVVVWLGHSTVFVQTGGVRFLFDPVLTCKMPVTLFMRPFVGTDVYTPADIPAVDYLVITHDHWDHLDCATVKALRERVGKVVCPLGVGAHFEYWGYDSTRIVDMDWNDSLPVTEAMTLRCLPSRHFSGRLLGRNKTLWASYLIDGPRRVFVSGDGGYDDRFARIGEQYPGIDLAVMENGQYNDNWRHIHTLPSQLPQAITELGARRVLTYHNSKYALARHPWNEPLDSIWERAQGHPWQLLTPRMGEVVHLSLDETFGKWW